MSQDLRVEAVNTILQTFKYRDKRKILSELSKQGKLVDAFNTEVGQEILKDAIAHADTLLSKIINEDADEKDKAEYRVYRRLINKWGTKVENYISNLNKAVGGNK